MCNGKVLKEKIKTWKSMCIYAVAKGSRTALWFSFVATFRRHNCWFDGVLFYCTHNNNIALVCYFFLSIVLISSVLYVYKVRVSDERYCHCFRLRWKHYQTMSDLFRVVFIYLFNVVVVYFFKLVDVYFMCAHFHASCFFLVSVRVLFF